MLLPATADEADDDEFDADKEDKEDGGNPNRAILTDRARSRFPNSTSLFLIPLGKINFIFLFPYSATERAARFAFVRRSPESLRSSCSPRVCVREM